MDYALRIGGIIYQGAAFQMLDLTSLTSERSQILIEACAPLLASCQHKSFASICMDMNLAVFMNCKHGEIYYYVFYGEDARTPDGQYAIVSARRRPLQLIFTDFNKVSIGEGDVMTLSFLAKGFYERWMFKQGIILPWNSKVQNSKMIKHCERCGSYNSSMIKLKKCARCKCVYYCSRHCQKISWKLIHRMQCL
eukprot:79762_1